MKIKLAGGVGEHGRSCFLVSGARMSFLVDCGLMAGEREPYPHLTPDEIRTLDYVFLTHSHADHTGAMPWLEENGFKGVVAATNETLSQLKNQPAAVMTLDRLPLPDGMTLKCGRSGHCAGSVWYRFEIDGRAVLFSGDYTESSIAYDTDPIRGECADAAILDCAYASEKRTPDEMRADFLRIADKYIASGRPLLLPVPKYGRGLEIALLLHRAHPELAIYGDNHFAAQVESTKHDEYWFTRELKDGLAGVQPLPLSSVPQSGICFVSDPQLRSAEYESLARGFAAAGGGVVLTGTIEQDTGSARLSQDGLAVFSRIPVHSTASECDALVAVNSFDCVIKYHSAEVKYPCEEIRL